MTEEQKWETARDSYLQQAESDLKAAGHLKPREILDDVRTHLDQKYAELSPERRTWENIQKIITEMGPAWDYAELLGSKERKKNNKGYRYLAGLLICLSLVLGVYIKMDKKDGLIEQTALNKEAHMVISGQCHCGIVKYQVHGSIIKCSYCDCRGCQRATGTLKAPFVTVSRRDLKILSGELADFRASSGEKCDFHGEWMFCPKCGAPIYWKGNKGDEADLFAGSLDDPSLFRIAE